MHWTTGHDISEFFRDKLVASENVRSWSAIRSAETGIICRAVFAVFYKVSESAVSQSTGVFPVPQRCSSKDHQACSRRCFQIMFKIPRWICEIASLSPEYPHPETNMFHEKRCNFPNPESGSSSKKAHQFFGCCVRLKGRKASVVSGSWSFRNDKIGPPKLMGLLMDGVFCFSIKK